MDEDDSDFWREREILLSGLFGQAAGVLAEMIDYSVEDGEVDYFINLREISMNASDVFSPPGEPEEGWRANVVSLDRYRAKVGR